MTSNRTIENRLSALEQQVSADRGLVIVWEGPETGERYTDPGHTDPVDAVADNPLMIVVRETVVETEWKLDGIVAGES